MPEPTTEHSEADGAYVDLARTAAKRLGVREEGPDPSRDALADLEDILPLDADPPAASASPALRIVKSAVKRLVRWYFSYLAGQVTALGEATLRLGSNLADHVDDLETASKAQAARIEELEHRLRRLEPPPDDRQ